MNGQGVTPRRIRRRRAKGWRLAETTANPNGAAVVDRTSRWGNPFAVRRDGDGWVVVDLGTGDTLDRLTTEVDARRVAVEWFRAFLADRPELVAAARPHLAGRDLACFCPEDGPCHADVWLEVVNDDGDRPS
jgi:hypothetical protein